ncbi:MAG: tRNA (N6-isopentenyl adenosine(37)-C2)-methylthiotransferase MiaB [bacterium]|nr:tRNA (N6-isopentenyl adenosine(37)-C2)-methylthiotransferase MiaB [bacterium]
MADFHSELKSIAQPSKDGQGCKVFIETYGCQMNVYDSQAIDGLLDKDGFDRARDVFDADVILLNTCSVRELAEHKITSRVGEIRQQRVDADAPPAIIGICGCMAERLGIELQKGKNRVDLVVGVDNYDKLPGMLTHLMGKGKNQKRRHTATGHRTDAHYVAPPSVYPVNNSHLVTIHKGCDYKCTYCIVPYTRGPQTEKSPEAIVQEINTLVDSGAEEVTLLGQNVTAYHWQQELDFAALLESVAEIDGLKRIRFLTGHPKDMHKHTMDVIGGLDKVCPWLHLPIQSGSNAVLRRMKRLYKQDEYLNMVDYAKKVIPGVTFSTDIIVGFPGETEEDFQATLEVLRLVKYDQIFSFKYSVRPGVPAAKLNDNVSLDEKKRRLAEVIKLQDEIWLAEAEEQVGKTLEGIVESAAKHPKDSWRVRTANNRKFVVSNSHQGNGLKIGDSVSAKITGIASTTFLTGD